MQAQSALFANNHHLRLVNLATSIDQGWIHAAGRGGSTQQAGVDPCSWGGSTQQAGVDPRSRQGWIHAAGSAFLGSWLPMELECVYCPCGNSYADVKS